MGTSKGFMKAYMAYEVLQWSVKIEIYFIFSLKLGAWLEGLSTDRNESSNKVLTIGKGNPILPV